MKKLLVTTEFWVVGQGFGVLYDAVVQQTTTRL